jgi:hypothetical protein
VGSLRSLFSCFLGWYARQKAFYTPKPRRPYEYLVNRYYAHKVDLVFTVLCDKLGLSPNQVTLMSMVCGVGAGFLIAAEYFFWAAICIQAHHILDGVDGNLARAKGLTSNFGKWLDVVSDQCTRFSVLVGLALAAQAPALWVGLMFFTFYIDVLIIHWLVLPYARRYPLVRAPWKVWFMNRGLMPAFDIFTMYFLVSICLVAQTPTLAVYLIVVLKTLDWGYRVWECIKTHFSLREQSA